MADEATKTAADAERPSSASAGAGAPRTEAGVQASGGPKDPQLDDASDPLLGLAEAEDDDAPAPETGLHALGQLGTAVLVVGVVLVIFFFVALAFGWIFN